VVFSPDDRFGDVTTELVRGFAGRQGARVALHVK